MSWTQWQYWDENTSEQDLAWKSFGGKSLSVSFTLPFSLFLNPSLYFSLFTLLFYSEWDLRSFIRTLTLHTICL